MIEILANRTYRHLFAAQVIALIGTGLLTVALGLLAFELAGERAGAVLGTALAIKMVAMSGSRRSSAVSLTGCRAAPSSSRWTWRGRASRCFCPL